MIKIKINPIYIPEPKVKTLDELLSKYLYTINDEKTRQDILYDIEKYFIQNANSSYNRNDNKSLRDHIENVKLEYYTLLVNQSSLDEDIKKEMILKYIENRNI